MRSFMSAEEISRLIKALSELGVCKIRLTGGEPTVVQGKCLSSKKPKS
jgi:cyclic pyranopterin phosphate synthase